MEATERYGEDLANFLYISNHLVSIVNLAQIKYYARSLLKRTKIDKIDSQLLPRLLKRTMGEYSYLIRPLVKAGRTELPHPA